MKRFKNPLLIFLFLVVSHKILAQNNEDAHSLVKEGMKLYDDKKYNEAIEKYNQALKIDSGYLFADYEVALSLYALDKGQEGLTYLKKVIAANTSLNAAAYDLSGLIYFRSKQYAEAEKCAIGAIKADPKNAGSQRMYALVCFHQNKRANALLGLCSFILLEPQTARSAEAYGNIQHILKGGVLKPEPGVANYPPDADTYDLNHAITNAVAEADKQKYATEADLLAAQLKNIFIAVGQLAAKQTGNDFFRNYLAAYFYKLAQSPNMPAFARLINQSTSESAAWAKANAQQMTDLDNWVKAAERAF
jgi:tetratricopeptide (TPR) repeat protein